MAKNQTRKCKYCNNIIDLKKDKWLKEKKRYIHKQCLINREIGKGNSQNFIQELIDKLIGEFKEEQQEKLNEKIKKHNEKKEKAKKSLETKEQRKIDRKIFLEYIQNTYQIKALPKYFFVKLSNINNGTYEGLSRGIPYNHLLDMFKRKRKYLDRIAFDKNRKGNGFKNDTYRLYFDLTVVVNSYDSYLRWKEKQKKLNSQVDNKKNNDVLKFMTKQKQNIIKNIAQQNKPKVKDISKLELDIDSIIDDI